MSDILRRISELERRVSNIITIGTISDVDYEKSLVQVTAGDLVTGWLPWLTRRAGQDVDFWAPEVNEQVLVISENGDLELGVVLPSLYRDMSPALDNRETVQRTKFQDGSVIEYDRQSSTYTVNIVGDVVINAAKNVTVDAAQIKLNGGTGCITGESICHFTGSPHADASVKVFAGK